MNKRKVGLIAGGLILVAIVALFGVKMQYESRIRNDIENLLAGLPQPFTAQAERIDVSFFDNSVILTNLELAYTVTVGASDTSQTVPMSNTIERVTAVGINVDGFKEGAGTVKLLDSLELINSKFISPMAQSSIARYAFENISGDAHQIRTELAKALPLILAPAASQTFDAGDIDQERFLAGFTSLLKAYETISIGSSVFTDYQYSVTLEGSKIEVTMKSGESKDATIREMGPVAIKDITAAVDGAPLFSMGSLGMDEAVIPSFIPFFQLLGSKSIPDPGMVKNAFRGQPFALKNLRLTNMAVRHPAIKDVALFTLGDASFSYVAETAHTLDFTFTKLDIAKAVILNQTGLPERTLADLPETISLEGVVQQVTTPKETGAFDIEAKKILFKSSGLGEASLSFSFTNLNPMAAFLGMPNMGEIKGFDLSLTDAGFSETAFAVSGLSDGNTSAQAREAEVASLREILEMDPAAPGKEIITGLADFLEKPGKTLRIAITPASPVSVDEAQTLILTDPSALGLTVTVTPGK